MTYSTISSKDEWLNNTHPLNKTCFVFSYTSSNEERLNLADCYLIFCSFLMPTYCIGLINRHWFSSSWYDYNLFYFAISLLLFLYPGKKYLIPGLSCIKALCLYIIFEILLSICIYKYSIKDVTVALRNNLFHPIIAYAFIHAYSGLSYFKTIKILRIAFLCFVVQVIQFLLTAIWGIDITFVPRPIDKIFDADNFENVRANMYLYPAYEVFIILILLTISQAKHIRYYILSAVCFITPFASCIRNLIAKSILEFTFIVFLTTIISKKQKNISLKSNYIFIFLLCILLATTLIFFPHHIERIAMRWIPNLDSSIAFDSYSSTTFRYDLVKLSIDKNKDSIWNILFGSGYKKDEGLIEFRPNYCIVLGSDSPIAAVIYCEGAIGVLFRLLPYLFMFNYALRSYIESYRKSQQVTDEFILDLFVMSIIFGEAIVFLFTNALTKLQYYYFLMALLFIITRKKDEV